ncbi:hypothetical protein [Vallitalea sp.]|jgi:hypothetical protein|uniref:hypothetical protein n=1 Tax=Vallitalea sp. TaxID=1882829 RepID=UPI0025D8EAB6|nr:hypothetical protein [Vallitalea sp.]MCT4687978.1 hypothetical protein [Vallitalea sp.]
MNKEHYKKYIYNLIKECHEINENDYLSPIFSNDYMRKTRIALLKEQKYKELASIYQLLGMHCRNLNDLYLDSFLTYNFYANSLLNISCYYSKHGQDENYYTFLQYIASSNEKLLTHLKDIDDRFIYTYALNIELLGDMYLLINHIKSKDYYDKAKSLYKDIDKYEQLSTSNDFWCSFSFIETSIALKECFDLEISFNDLGLERIKQKNELLDIFK